MSPDEQKQQAHLLVDCLDATQLAAVIHLLTVMTDPVSRAIARAPLDDEPLTADDIKALDEAREWAKHNQGTPQEQFMQELGISPEEVERLNQAR